MERPTTRRPRRVGAEGRAARERSTNERSPTESDGAEGKHLPKTLLFGKACLAETAWPPSVYFHGKKTPKARELPEG